MVHRVHFDMKWKDDFGHCIIVDMDIIQCTTSNGVAVSRIISLVIKRVHVRNEVTLQQVEFCTCRGFHVFKRDAFNVGVVDTDIQVKLKRGSGAIQ